MDHCARQKLTTLADSASMQSRGINWIHSLETLDRRVYNYRAVSRQILRTFHSTAFRC